LDQAQWLIPVTPASQEAEIEKIAVGAKKLLRPSSQQINQAWWYMPVTPAMQ
jgi:hypothetical protein